MRVDRQLPRADVAGQQNHTAPFGHRAEVIFQAFVDDYRRDVFAAESRELADLAEQSPEVAERAAPDTPALALVETGEGQPQVDLRVAAQMWQNREGERPDHLPGPQRERARRQADDLQDRPRDGVFDPCARQPTPFNGRPGAVLALISVLIFVELKLVQNGRN